MLLGSPDAKRGVPAQALGSVQLFLEGRQCRGDHTLVYRGQGYVIAEGAVSTALGIRGKPRGDAVPRHPEPRGDLVAIARLPTCRQIHGLTIDRETIERDCTAM